MIVPIDFWMSGLWGTAYTQAVSGSLSFVGTRHATPARRFSGSLSFSGGLRTFATHMCRSALSFISGTNQYPDPALYPAPDQYPYGGGLLVVVNHTLTGSLRPVAVFLTHSGLVRTFTAVLQPAVVFAWTSSRRVSGSLSFSGSFSAQATAHVFAKALFASLRNAGALSTIVNPGVFQEGGGGYGVPMPDAFFQRYQPTLRRQKAKV